MNLTKERRLIYLILLSLFFVALELNMGARAAKDHHYALSAKKQGGYELLSLLDTSSGRTIWAHTVSSHSNVEWSENHRSVCIDVSSTEHEAALLVWVEGSPESVLTYDDDYYMPPAIWSLDGKNILFRTGHSGFGDADLGTLRCLNLRTKKIKTLMPEGGIRKMKWTAANSVSYWGGGFDGQQIVIDKKPKNWIPF